MILLNKIKILFLFVKALFRFARMELRRGTYKENFRSLRKSNEVTTDMSWAELLEESAVRHSSRVFLAYKGKEFTYMEMDQNANRIANFLLGLGGNRGKGVALFMSNSPQFLDLFFGTQKIGMYTVPVNNSLRGDSLLYILNHCDAEYIVLDEEFLDIFQKISGRLENIKTIIINPAEGPSKQKIDRKYISLKDAYKCSPEKPGIKYNREDICLIIYTSGTTGLPKGVVYRYQKTTVKLLTIASYILIRKRDILYTCLSLCHGNALFLTMTQGMAAGARVVLGKKFSASRFWEDILRYNITVFNTIGAIIPILMKQPEKPEDRRNRVRFTLSAACPVDDWEKFEKRFGIKIYEGYGAVDGGGKSIMNLGTAPVGSIGKPPGLKVQYRLVDSEMNDVPDGKPGELIFQSSGSGKSVEYYKNPEATNEKLRDGWIFTGDLVRRDSRGYLYFVGRNTESMRIKGENVSAYEVEHAILKHPAVLEAAVYAVPSELAEDDIMASITLVENKKISEEQLVEFLMDDLPKFALPRYVRIVREFPKTETQRIIKKEIQELGTADGTYDSRDKKYI